MSRSDEHELDTLRRSLEAERRRADRLQYLAHMLQIPILAEQGHCKRVRDLLDQTPHTPSDFAWGYWNRRATFDALVLRDPDRRINAADFSPDGKRVILGYEGGLAVVWDLQARRAVCVLDPFTRSSLVSGKDDLTGYAVLTPDQVPEEIEGLYYEDSKSSSAVQGVGFFPDGGRVWTLTHRGDLVLWDAVSGECLGNRSRHSGSTDRPVHRSVEAVVRSPDRQRAVLGGYDGTAWIVDLMEGSFHTLQGHSQCVAAVAWSCDGWLVATGSWDHTVKVWDASTKQEMRRLICETRVQAVALDNHAGTAAIVVTPRINEAPDLEFRDLATGETRTREPLPRFGRAHLGLSSDGKRLAVSAGTATRVWDLRLSVWEDTALPNAGVVAFSSDGRSLVAGECVQILSSTPSEILGYPRGETAKVLSQQSPVRVHFRGVKARGVAPVALSRDGTRLAGGVWGEEFDAVAIFGNRFRSTVHLDWGYVYDIATRESLFPLAGHQAPITALTYSSDGARLVVGSEDGAVIVHNAATGQPLSRLAGMHDRVANVAVSADGRWAAASGIQDVVSIWELQTGARHQMLPTDGTNWNSLAFSPDGRLLATAGRDRLVRLWNVETQQEVGVLQGHSESVIFLAFSPDGQLLLSGGAFQGAQIWEIATLRVRTSLFGQKQILSAAAWEPDGKHVITGDSGGTVRIWDTETGGLTLALQGHKETVTLAAFLDEGTVLTGSRDGVLRWWRAN